VHLQAKIQQITDSLMNQQRQGDFSHAVGSAGGNGAGNGGGDANKLARVQATVVVMPTATHPCISAPTLLRFG
jgi:hypothetical protein